MHASYDAQHGEQSPAFITKVRFPERNLQANGELEAQPNKHNKTMASSRPRQTNKSNKNTKENKVNQTKRGCGPETRKEPCRPSAPQALACSKAAAPAARR